MKTLYEILGIDRNATPDEIKAAYRERAKKCHPDTADGDEEAMQGVNRAYEVLKNPTTRKEYDDNGEEAATKTRQDRVMEHVAKVSAELIAKNPPDIKVALDHLCEAWKRSYTYGRKQKEREKTGLIAFKKRIVNAPERDILSMTIDDAIYLLEADIRQIDDDFEDRMEALKFLDQYTFADTVQDAPEYGTSVTGTYATA